VRACVGLPIGGGWEGLNSLYVPLIGFFLSLYGLLLILFKKYVISTFVNTYKSSTYIIDIKIEINPSLS